MLWALEQFLWLSLASKLGFMHIISVGGVERLKYSTNHIWNIFVSLESVAEFGYISPVIRKWTSRQQLWFLLWIIWYGFWTSQHCTYTHQMTPCSEFFSFFFRSQCELQMHSTNQLHVELFSLLDAMRMKMSENSLQMKWFLCFFYRKFRIETRREKKRPVCISMESDFSF